MTEENKSNGYKFVISEVAKQTKNQYVYKNREWNYMPYWAHYTIKYNKKHKATCSNAYIMGYSNGKNFVYFTEDGRKTSIIDTPPNSKY